MITIVIAYVLCMFVAVIYMLFDAEINGVDNDILARLESEGFDSIPLVYLGIFCFLHF